MPSRIDWAAFFEAVPACLMVVDRELRFVTMNDAYLEATGRSREELVGKHIFDVFPETEEREAVFREALDRAFGGSANTIEEQPFSIKVSAGESGGTREVYWTCEHAPVRDRDGETRFVVQHATDVTAKVLADRRSAVVAAELDHRVRNMLTLVRLLGRRTARSSHTIEDFLGAFNGRLEAIERTHTMLMEENWTGTTLRALIEAELAPYMIAGGNDIEVEGPHVTLLPDDAQTLSLAIHELATNALKYGALSNSAGKLGIRWATTADGGFEIRWQETGAAGSSTPGHRGFGSTIIDEVTGQQLGGTVSRVFQDGRLFCTISKPGPAAHSAAA